MIFNELTAQPIQGDVQLSGVYDLSIAHAANLLINMILAET